MRLNAAFVDRPYQIGGCNYASQFFPAESVRLVFENLVSSVDLYWSVFRMKLTFWDKSSFTMLMLCRHLLRCLQVMRLHKSEEGSNDELQHEKNPADGPDGGRRPNMMMK